jgi:hypothetical protein
MANGKIRDVEFCRKKGPYFIWLRVSGDDRPSSLSLSFIFLSFREKEACREKEREDT